MRFIDLKQPSQIRGLFSTTWRIVNNEYRRNRIFSTDGIHAKVRVSQVRQPLSRTLQGKAFLVLGTIPQHGICPADLQRKSSRHRILPTRLAGKTISYGFQWHGCTQYTGQCQFGSGLAYLCGLCTSPDRRRTSTVRRRRSGIRTQENCLCARLYNDRPLFGSLSMGAISKTQSRHQTSYVVGCSCAYSYGYCYHIGKSTRCQYPRPIVVRAGGSVCNGSWLHGFRTPKPHRTGFSFLCNACQEKFQVSTSVLKCSGQERGYTVRPDRGAYRPKCSPVLSREITPHSLSRSLYRQKTCLFNQQPRSASNCYRQTV